MKIYKNEKLIKRNAQIGQYTTFAALLVLGAGMYISLRRQDLFIWSVAALAIGFIMTQVGMYFSNRFGRSPRQDEQLDAALKGLPGDTNVYHFIGPVPHLLVGPAGVWILHVYQQRGKVTYARDRWHVTGGGFMQAYMSVFGQEGLGRPDVDIVHDEEALKKYLLKHMEETELPEMHSALLFTNPDIEIDAADAPAPTLKVKQLKDFIRQRAKERPIGQLQLERVKSALPQPEAESA